VDTEDTVDTVDVSFYPITPESARALATWRYSAPYGTYDITNATEAMDEMLDARSPWFIAFDSAGAPLGYCCFGTAAEVGWEGIPRLWTTGNKMLSVGLGLRPDLTGNHFGLSFVEAVLSFAATQFAPSTFRLFVLPFNHRAIRVYERAGFEYVGERLAPDTGSDAALFLEMRRDATTTPTGKTS
jgi:[ribosomal protein S18]-alanine N-acetyltransferase